jgi:hypothetical protein
MPEPALKPQGPRFGPSALAFSDQFSPSNLRYSHNKEDHRNKTRQTAKPKTGYESSAPQAREHFVYPWWRHIRLRDFPCAKHTENTVSMICARSFLAGGGQISL